MCFLEFIAICNALQLLQHLRRSRLLLRQLGEICPDGFQRFSMIDCIIQREELADLLGAFGGTDPEFFPNELPSLSTIQAEVRSGDTYYNSELSVNAFLLMFRDVLRSVGLSVLECPVCGELFCGTEEDTCCGSADCRQYLETANLSRITSLKK